MSAMNLKFPEGLELLKPRKKGKKKKELNSNAWMVTFSDLIILMMTFFVLLFALNDPNHEIGEISISALVPGIFSTGKQSLSTESMPLIRANSLAK